MVMITPSILLFHYFVLFFIIWLKARLWSNMGFTGQFGGVHTFGYNSAESEPVWTKSGAQWVHSWGLALADFGHDQHSSDSLRGRLNFFWMINNARFHWFPVWQIFRNLNTTTSIDRDRMNRPLLFRDRISNCTNLFRPDPNRIEPHTHIRAAFALRHTCGFNRTRASDSVFPHASQCPPLH